MKLISQDHAFIYWVCDRTDGTSEGIRIGRNTGVVGFYSRTPAAQQVHPIRFTRSDVIAADLPVAAAMRPPILAAVIGRVGEQHPEVYGLLSGQITFEQALGS